MFFKKDIIIGGFVISKTLISRILGKTSKMFVISRYRVFSLTWPASMQMYWNKRKRLHKKRVQLPLD